MLKTILSLLTLICVPAVMRAQAPPTSTDGPAPATPAASAAGFTVEGYLADTLDPWAFLRPGLTAAIDQKQNDPPEWGQGSVAYSQRFGSRFGQLAIGSTTQHALSRRLRLDMSYRRCDCKFVLARMGHAILSTMTARTEDRRVVLSAPSIAAPYAGSFAAMLWRPDSTNVAASLRAGSVSIGMKAAVNLVREFVPRRK